MRASFCHACGADAHVQRAAWVDDKSLPVSCMVRCPRCGARRETRNGVTKVWSQKVWSWKTGGVAGKELEGVMLVCP